jgi:hypothetical protein
LDGVVVDCALAIDAQARMTETESARFSVRVVEDVWRIADSAEQSPRHLVV